MKDVYTWQFALLRTPGSTFVRPWHWRFCDKRYPFAHFCQFQYHVTLTEWPASKKGPFHSDFQTHRLTHWHSSWSTEWPRGATGTNIHSSLHLSFLWILFLFFVAQPSIISLLFHISQDFIGQWIFNLRFFLLHCSTWILALYQMLIQNTLFVNFQLEFYCNRHRYSKLSFFQCRSTFDFNYRQTQQTIYI